MVFLNLRRNLPFSNDFHTFGALFSPNHVFVSVGFPSSRKKYVVSMELIFIFWIPLKKLPKNYVQRILIIPIFPKKWFCFSLHRRDVAGRAQTSSQPKRSLRGRRWRGRSLTGVAICPLSISKLLNVTWFFPRRFECTQTLLFPSNPVFARLGFLFFLGFFFFTGFAPALRNNMRS